MMITEKLQEISHWRKDEQTNKRGSYTSVDELNNAYMMMNMYT